MATMNIFQWYWGHHVSRYLRAPNPKSHRHPPIAPLHLSHHSSASTELGVERERVEREKEGELALFTHGVRCSSARRRARSIEWMASDAATAAVEREGKSYWGMSARMCDSCRGAAALLFCRADSAFLCLGCDARVHGANRLASRHERVWMCEVCEQAPAAVTCKADAAALCTSCDADIHSANPLSRRHERTPVVPFCHSPAAAEDRRRAHAGGEDDDEKEEEEEEVEKDEDEEDVTAAWLLGSTVNKVGEEKEKEKMLPAGAAAGGGFFYPEVDPYLDLDYAASMDARFHHLDSVVPVQQHNRGSSTPMIQHHGQAVLGAPYDFSGVKPSYSYAPSLSHSVSSSEVGVVPDGNSLADVSNPYVTGVPANPAALMNPAAILAPAVGMDREARVLRYREKRKNRKFEKTIRYASRKAYAETRPRIKGRFAKRTDADQPDSGVEGILAGGGGMYSAGAAAQGLMLDHGYGVVPSF